MFCSSLIFSVCRSMMSLSQLVSPPDTEASTSTLELCSSGQPLTRETRMRRILRTAVLIVWCVLSCKNGSSSLSIQLSSAVYKILRHEFIHLSPYIWSDSFLRNESLSKEKTRRLGKKRKRKTCLIERKRRNPERGFCCWMDYYWMFTTLKKT